MKAIKIGAGILILLLGVFFIKNLFQEEEKVTTNAISTQNEEGMQVFTLSWGKLNYNPEVITVKKGQPVKIIADTERLQGCFRSFQIPDLGIQKSFTEKDKEVIFTPEKEGEFTFGCSMGMGRGKLVVE